jgi:hypothetical protein
MKTIPLQIPKSAVLSVFVAALTATATLGAATSSEETISPVITCQPSSLSALEFTPVTFSVKAEIPLPANPDLAGQIGLRYLWTRDGEAIPQATNSSYTIPHALQPYSTNTPTSQHHVGTYAVRVIPVLNPNELKLGSPILLNETVSRPIHLSVYSMNHTNSTSGTLSIPIGAFTPSSGSACCPNPPFDHYNVYFPFDGPGVRPRSTNFPNMLDETNLVITTCLRQNPTTLNTGIEIKQNFLPMNTVCCNDDGGTQCGKLSECWFRGMETGKTYRVGIFIQKSTLVGSSVSFKWTYTNY